MFINKTLLLNNLKTSTAAKNAKILLFLLNFLKILKCEMFIICVEATYIFYYIICVAVPLMPFSH